jgi:hypothetical protein
MDITNPDPRGTSTPLEAWRAVREQAQAVRLAKPTSSMGMACLKELEASERELRDSLIRQLGRRSR